MVLNTVKQWKAKYVLMLGTLDNHESLVHALKLAMCDFALFHWSSGTLEGSVRENECDLFPSWHYRRIRRPSNTKKLCWCKKSRSTFRKVGKISNKPYRSCKLHLRIAYFELSDSQTWSSVAEPLILRYAGWTGWDVTVEKSVWVCMENDKTKEGEHSWGHALKRRDRQGLLMGKNYQMRLGQNCTFAFHYGESCW